MSEAIIFTETDAATQLEQQADTAGVVHGLERAALIGFDLERSVAANYGFGMPVDFAPARACQVVDMAAGMAADLQLEDSFFARPANVMLLTAIADSWITNDEKALELPHHDQRLANERIMLVDVALMLARGASGAVRELAEADKLSGGAEEARAAQQREARRTEREFFDQLHDTELAQQVTALFCRPDGASPLEFARQKLGRSAATERPFDLKVVKLATFDELCSLGIVEETTWPDCDEHLTDPVDIAARQEAERSALVHAARQDMIARPYQQALDAYNRQFYATCGPLPQAWVYSSPEQNVMYLREPDARMLLAVAARDRGYDTDAHLSDEEAYAVGVLRHEYGHTQADLIHGERGEFGILLEERKGDIVSSGRPGYRDAQHLLNELGVIRSVNIRTALLESCRGEDPVSAFMAWSATNLGLRTALLLQLARPGYYEQKPAARELLADLRSVRRAGDQSIHDALLRENLEMHGEARIREHALAWAGMLIARHGAVDARVSDMYYAQTVQRKWHSITHTSHYYAEAVDELLEQGMCSHDGRRWSAI